MNVHDAIHGTIVLSPLCAAFASHRWFKRLQRIQQLGTVALVFPEATHTRWEHSIGTCHLAQQLLATLRRHGADVAPWEADAVALAALLHDVGHGPFSHAFDRFVQPLPLAHEQRSQCLMRLMARDLAHCPAVAALTPQQLEWAVSLIDPCTAGSAADGRAFLHEIVSNAVCGMDVDKMDYLLRDHWMLTRDSGLQRNTIDMLRRCRVNDAGHLAFDIRDADTLVALSERRLALHRTCYGHAQVEAAGVMVGDILTGIMALQPPAASASAWAQQVAELDDSAVRTCAERADVPPSLRALASRFVRRDLYQHVCDTVERPSTPPGAVVIPWEVATTAQAPHRAVPRIPFHNGTLARQVLPQGSRTPRRLYRTIATTTAADAQSAPSRTSWSGCAPGRPAARAAKAAASPCCRPAAAARASCSPPARRPAGAASARADR